MIAGIDLGTTNSLIGIWRDGRAQLAGNALGETLLPSVVSFDEDGTVYVNEERLDEPYVKEPSRGNCNITFPYQVPESSWFVMGDYRATSLDSRVREIGCIYEEMIVGRIVFRIWPLNGFGRITG